MPRDAWAIVLATLVLATSDMPACAGAQPAAQSGLSGAAAATAETDLPSYVPPMRGAPRGRIGGASRGAGGNAASMEEIDVIAPDHVGLTRREQPTLYWFSKGRVPTAAVFTLIPTDTEKPLVERVMPGPQGPGIHAVPLAGSPVRLAPGREYEWSISVPDPGEDRSRDIVASGILKRDASGSAPPENVSAVDAARIDARSGRFYDAIEDISRALAGGATGADAAALRHARAALLDQVGLDAAAAFDRAPH